MYYIRNLKYFNVLLLILFFLDENECDELFTKLKLKLKTKWTISKITKAAISFVDLVASKCNKEQEFAQFLIEVLFSLEPEK